MSSKSELSDSSTSSVRANVLSAAKNRRIKRKRGLGIDDSSSDAPGSLGDRVKKSRATEDLKFAQHEKSSEKEASSGDSSANEDADDSSHESIEGDSVVDTPKREKTNLQTKSSGSAIDSDDEIKATSGEVSTESDKTDSDSNNCAKNVSNLSVPLKSSKKYTSSPTGSLDEGRRQTASMKNKLSKEKLPANQGDSDNSSDDESLGKSKLSRARSKLGWKSKLQIQTKNSSTGDNTASSLLEENISACEDEPGKQTHRKKKFSKGAKGGLGSSDKVKHKRSKESDDVQTEEDSELSDVLKSHSVMRVDSSNSELKKNSKNAKNVTVSKRKRTKNVKKKQNKSTDAVKSKLNSSESSSDSDSGLEGSNNETSKKEMTDGTPSGRAEPQETSSSGSDSEPLVSKRNKEGSTEKPRSSHSDVDSETDKQRSRSSSNAERQIKTMHTVSSSDTDSEDGSKLSRTKEKKEKKNQKHKTDKDANEKKLANSEKDAHKDRGVLRAKRYVKEAGLRVGSYAALWAGCRSNKARARAIIDFLREHGLSGTPTLDKCKRLRLKNEKKNEARELDLANIISTGRESRRNVSAPASKPVDQDNPTKRHIQQRFARIQALGDSDSSSE
ncbi:HIRA-interacting protein 3-like [Bacillus rossius redtenbacheri]|uniref:HIRA-interacting protein 3-like n=1 Tax=Bacillus rossius redtenbacheri TaxID=93214 RepID=UPI002FDCC87A